jgi:predicted TIM-barrel fold metal-dependent hydrolase
MAAVDVVPRALSPDLWSGTVIDVDVHANVPSLAALDPYLEPVWKQFIHERGWKGPVGVTRTYPPRMPGYVRPEWKPDGDRVPASDVDLLREHILDPWNVDRAIVNCYYAIDSIRHPDLASAITRAVNDWLVNEWLDRDPRLRASLVIPPRSPADAIREVERVGDHPGFVQVLLPVRSDRLYGNRVWHPLYAAMVERDLVMGLHWGGSGEGAPSPSGWPSWYVEEYAAEMQAYTAQVTSVIAEGVFRSFPGLRMSVLEIGFAWLPGWGWRLDKDWKGLHREIPWLDKAPTSLIREHMRFSTAPIDAGPPEDIARVLRWLDSEELLMFATDYPHEHDDDLGAFLGAMPESMRPKVMAENARSWYRL